MSRLERVEDLLEEKIERLFQGSRDRLDGAELVREVVRAVEHARVEILDGEWYPNRVTVRIARDDLRALGRLAGRLVEEIEAEVARRIRLREGRLLGDVRASVVASDSVAPGTASIALGFDPGARRRAEDERNAAGWLVLPGGERLPVPLGGGVLGRAPDVDVVIDDPAVSRRHARVTVDGDCLLVEDLGSRNALRYRGREVTAARLSPGEAIGVGGVVVRWEPRERGGPPGQSRCM